MRASDQGTIIGSDSCAREQERLCHLITEWSLTAVPKDKEGIFKSLPAYNFGKGFHDKACASSCGVVKWGEMHRDKLEARRFDAPAQKHTVSS